MATPAMNPTIAAWERNSVINPNLGRKKIKNKKSLLLEI